MKNTLIGAALLTAVSLPTSAGMLGLDWEATGEYNIDKSFKLGVMVKKESLNLLMDLLDFQIWIKRDY